MLIEIPDDDIACAPIIVVGYHGCDKTAADRLLAGEPFRLSANDYDWLGSGVYFWEYAPYRAREWAQKRFGDDWAVLRAEIRLGSCLNLLDTDYADDLKRVHRELISSLRLLGSPVPENRRGANRLDRLIFDEFNDQFLDVGGSFDTVRACFPEGPALYDGSKLLSQTHVQIAVRNQACIEGLKLVNLF